jgi:hypothetical protein
MGGWAAVVVVGMMGPPWWIVFDRSCNVRASAKRDSQRVTSLPPEWGRDLPVAFIGRNHFSANNTAPTVMNAPPAIALLVSGSRKKSAAKTNTKTTLSLSTGATFEASPSCSARK